jgi:L-asparaginase
MDDAVWHAYDPGNRREGVLVIYTGGTIGSMPRDPGDRDSPMVAVDWTEFRRRTSSLSERLADGRVNARYIGFNVDGCSLRPLDSSNVGPAEWAEIARIVGECYDRYEGFVVLHGTDTMVYTASALSFMLENLGKPVVLTGALIPHLFNVRNDALQNLLTALAIANPRHTGIPVVPEVSVYFDHTLLRGNRARKVHASGFRAFRSVNYPALATAGERIVVHRRAVRMADPGRRLRVRTHLDPRVASIIFFPGIQDSPVLPDVLDDPDLRGVVLMTYGAGTVPSHPRLLKAIEAAVDRGVVAVAVTQCGGGQVELERYDASVRLLEAGVVTGTDMTAEAALTKLMVLLGDPDLDPDQVAMLVQRDLAGEQSSSVFVTRFDDADRCAVTPDAPRARLAARPVEGHGRGGATIERVLLRFRGAQTRTGDGGSLALRLFLDWGRDEALSEQDDRYLGARRKEPHDEAHIVMFDITAACRRVLGARASFTLALGDEAGQGSFAWESAELVIVRGEDGRLD